jgi:hypothetical protein
MKIIYNKLVSKLNEKINEENLYNKLVSKLEENNNI